MKKIIFCILSISFGYYSFSQIPKFEWAKNFGGIGFSKGYAISVDASGNVFTTGVFQGKVDFDPDSITTYYLTSAGSDDIFVSKLDASGKFLWACSFGGISNDVGKAIGLDSKGNVYVTGYFRSDTVDFDPGTSKYDLIAIEHDIFVLKLNPNGDFKWAKQIGGYSTDVAYSITMDALGNIFTSGIFSNKVDFDPAPSTKFELSTTGYYNAFILKLDTAGKFIWAKQTGGNTTNWGYSITCDSKGFIYYAGVFQGKADLNPDPAATNYFTSKGLSDIFISKLDSKGNLIWCKTLKGTQIEIINSITLDGKGNLYATGTFRDTTNFSTDTTKVFNLISKGNDDIFILKLDTAGKFKWVKSMGSVNDDFGNSIFTDNSGNIYTTGSFQGMADFDPSTSSVFNLTSSNSSNDMFITKLDPSGNLIGAIALGGAAQDYGHGIFLNNKGNIYTTGGFQSKVDFDPSAGFYSLKTLGYMDIFVHKMSDGKAGKETLDKRNDIAIYPNPTNGILYINNPSSKNMRIQILNSLGQVVMEKLIENSAIVNIEHFNRGIYIIKLMDLDKTIAWQRIIKQ